MASALALVVLNLRIGFDPATRLRWVKHVGVEQWHGVKVEVLSEAQQPYRI